MTVDNNSQRKTFSQLLTVQSYQSSGYCTESIATLEVSPAVLLMEYRVTILYTLLQDAPMPQL